MEGFRLLYQVVTRTCLANRMIGPNDCLRKQMWGTNIPRSRCAFPVYW